MNSEQAPQHDEPRIADHSFTNAPIPPTALSRSAPPGNSPPTLDVAKKRWSAMEIAHAALISVLVAIALFLAWYAYRSRMLADDMMRNARKKLAVPAFGPPILHADFTDRDLVGIWRKEQDDVRSQLSLAVNGDFEWSEGEEGQGGPRTIRTGKWRLQGNTLKLKVLDMNRDGLLQDEEEVIDGFEKHRYQATNPRTKQRVLAQRIR